MTKFPTVTFGYCIVIIPTRQSSENHMNEESAPHEYNIVVHDILLRMEMNFARFEL